jgi:hypothetical protein
MPISQCSNSVTRGRLTQPGQLRTEFRLLSVDAEPDRAGWVPGADVLTRRHLCKVRLEGAWVVCTGVDVDLDA